jgi:hypothetical protein
MISREFATQLGPVLAAQRNVLHELAKRCDTAAASAPHAISDAEAIASLDLLLAEIEDGADYLLASDMELLEPDAVTALLQQKGEQISADLGVLQFDDWSDFVRQCVIYDTQHGLDPMRPYEAFLTDADVAKLKTESYDAQLRWDSWDYVAVGVAGTLAALTDLLLVRIPRSIHYQGGPEQLGSPLTTWLKRYDTGANAAEFRKDWFANWARGLEAEARVPYDGLAASVDGQLRSLGGAGGRSHRFQTLGHDPVLGFVFGVLDILRGTMTGFSYDNLTGSHEFFSGTRWNNLDPPGVIEALLTQFKHLVSDVATPQGVPAPFLTLAQAFNQGSFGPKGRSIGEVARWMYLNGYDLRHFLVGGLVPGLVEVILRAFLMIRHYQQHGEVKFRIAQNPKYRLMLLSAHGIASIANAGKVYLHAGNPLAINEAQWIAFARYLFPTLKYWAFDRQRLRFEHLERITDSEWGELEASSSILIRHLAGASFPVVELGREH